MVLCNSSIGAGGRRPGVNPIISFTPIPFSDGDVATIHLYRPVTETILSSDKGKPREKLFGQVAKLRSTHPKLSLILSRAKWPVKIGLSSIDKRRDKDIDRVIAKQKLSLHFQHIEAYGKKKRNHMLEILYSQ